MKDNSRHMVTNWLSCPFATFHFGLIDWYWLIKDTFFHFVVVQSLCCVRLFTTLWSAACQDSLSSTISWSLLKLMSIESVMPSNHLVICRPLLLLPSIFPSIRIFSDKSTLNQVTKVVELQLQLSNEFQWIQSLMNIQAWFPLGFTGLISLQSKGLSRVFSNTINQKHQFLSTELSLYSQLSHPYMTTEKP